MPRAERDDVAARPAGADRGEDGPAGDRDAAPGRGAERELGEDDAACGVAGDQVAAQVVRVDDAVRDRRRVEVRGRVGRHPGHRAAAVERPRLAVRGVRPVDVAAVVRGRTDDAADDRRRRAGHRAPRGLERRRVERPVGARLLALADQQAAILALDQLRRRAEVVVRPGGGVAGRVPDVARSLTVDAKELLAPERRHHLVDVDANGLTFAGS